MKKLLIFTLIAAMASPLFAQNKGSIDGVIVDAEGNGVAGSIITLSSPNISPIRTATKYNGLFEIQNVDYGNYDMSVTFLGYDSLSRRVTVDKTKVSLGRVTLYEAAQNIENVTIEVNAIRTSQAGDTVSYNADAFKVAADATAENLLSKMPGIMVENGTVEAQGEEIKRVYVDGKEFFGDDVTTAIKNLPSEVIKSIEVFNKLSDNAEFTGVDDGEGYKAINIVTNTGGGMNSGQFGKVYGGYAHDGDQSRYQAGISGNYFTQKHRFSIIGMSNNLNQQNFGVDDILGAIGSSGSRGGRSRGGSSGDFMVSTQDGISDVNSIGFNYASGFSQNFKMEVSYFFNHTNNMNLERTEREYLTDSDTRRYYYAQDTTNTINYNHRFNGRFEWKINDNHSIMWRPTLTYQKNVSYYNGAEQNVEDDLYLNEVVGDYDKDKYGYSVNSMFMYRTKFNDEGRSIMASITNSFSKNDTWTTSYYDTFTAVDGVLDTNTISEYTYQKILDGETGHSHKGRLSYNEPISTRSTLTAAYNVNYSYSESDYLVHLWQEVVQSGYFSDVYDEDLSNSYNSGYLTHSVGPGYRYMNPNDKTTFNASVYYQRSSLMNEQTYPVGSAAIDPVYYNDITYFAMLSKPFNSTNTLRMFLRSSTSNPSVSQLQNVLDVTNPQYVSGGNENLDRSYTHSFRASYVRSHLTKGRTFMLMASATIVQDYIGSQTVTLMDDGATYTIPSYNYELADYGQYSVPVNLDGRWNVSGSFNFGTPVNFLKSNLNIGGGITYTESPTSTLNLYSTSSDYNFLTNMQNTTTYSYSASLGSNISENVDFTLSYKGGYNITQYDIATSDLSNNIYLTNVASLGFKFVMPWGITLSGSGSYTQYLGVTDDYNYDYKLLNVYIGKKLFKGNRGEIQFGVTDILDESGDTFSRNVADTYIENVFNNGLGRYYGITLTYNFRNFRVGNTSSSSNFDDSRRDGPPDGGPGGGGPGGMF
ncbi:MAG: outer membrane beta-barrel protein [Rikenellaceae bacterium]